MKKVLLIEEVSPESGYTKEEIEKTIWNSPPSEKGEGRYFITGKTIEKKDFRQIDAYYWDADFLEDCDMFFLPPGWRIGLTGINYLKKAGYAIEINTIEERKKQARKEKQDRIKKEKEEQKTREQNKIEYESQITEFEKMLGSPEWGERREDDGMDSKRYTHHIQSKNATIHSDEYTTYTLMPDGRVFCHQHINFDWWNNVSSTNPVSEQGQKFFAEKQKEFETQQAAQKAEAKKQLEKRNTEIKAGFQAMLDRGITWEYIKGILPKGKRFCPKELTDENGRSKYGEWTVAEAKKIINQ